MSPVSVKATLAMLLEGAGGETASQIRTALRLPEHQAKVQAVIHAYLEDLKVSVLFTSGYGTSAEYHKLNNVTLGVLFWNFHASKTGLDAFRT